MPSLLHLTFQKIARNECDHVLLGQVFMLFPVPVKLIKNKYETLKTTAAKGSDNFSTGRVGDV